MPSFPFWKTALSATTEPRPAATPSVPFERTLRFRTSDCTPTATHVDLAIKALELGHHVLVEKPVALTSNEVQRLADAVSRSDRLCMPAMCMRFWPGWTWLKDRVESGASGAVLSARFERMGGPPGWSPEFYMDPANCGGAILDLHIHDVDFMTYLFGMPRAVDSRGTGNHVTTLYEFADGPRLVSATGGWINAPSFPFRMRYTVEFEQGVADFDIGRDQPLMWFEGTDETAIDIGGGDGYIGQIEHFAAAIRGTIPGLAASVDEVVGVTRVIEAERASLESGQRVELAQ